MLNRSRSTRQSDLDRELEILQDFRNHIAKLTADFHERQAALLAAVSASLRDRAIVVAALVRNGSRLRWGQDGWQIQDSGFPVPCEMVLSLHSTGLIRGEEGVAVSAEIPTQDAMQPSAIEELLCDEWSAQLDRVSIAMLKYEQERALFRRIGDLRDVYRRTSEIRHAANYPFLLREKLHWWTALGRLYLAATLNVFVGHSEFRLSLARRSLATMEQISPGILDEL